MSNNFKISEYTTIKESTNSSVNHPKHQNVGAIEVIDVIEDWNLNFCLGNAIKYITRCAYKKHKKEDLEKAKWYIERELKKLEILEIQEQFKAEGNEV